MTAAAAFDRTRLWQVFVAESNDELAAMEEALLALEEAPAGAGASGDDDDDERVQLVFRVLHTLKGNAAALAHTALAELAHRAEDALERARSGGGRLTPDRVTLLLIAVDALRAELARPPGDALGPPGTTARAGVLASVPDRLLGLSGELGAAHARLGALLPAGAARDAHAEVEGLHEELRRLALRARMVPVGPLFRRYARMVRDLGAAAGKQARLEVTGAEVELDAEVLEALAGPLTQLVRNALAHGIEAPTERRLRGKPACGRVTLGARAEAGAIVVEVRDDGAGLDRERIARRAGLDPAVADVDRLVFAPGFSTAEAVTPLAGRGVGLDVVRTTLYGLGGSVAVESVAGQGTRVALRAPLTLAVIDGLAVSAGEVVYLLPLDVVAGCHQLAVAPAPGLVRVGGETLPYCHLTDLLAATLPAHAASQHGPVAAQHEHAASQHGPADTVAAWSPSPRAGRHSVVVVAHGRTRAALGVDGLGAAGQIVLRPLGPLFQRLPGLAGATILGSGRVGLILDVPAILHTLARSAGQKGATI